MIHARPQTSTFFSFLLFLIISYVLLGISIFVVITDPMPQWFNYLIIGILTPVAIFVSYRVLFRYKSVSMGDGQIEVRYPQFRFHRKYSLEEVAYWKESLVKTGKTTNYKELEVKFTDGRVMRLGYREYTEYEKMVRYLAQKVPKLKKSE